MHATRRFQITSIGIRNCTLASIRNQKAYSTTSTLTAKAGGKGGKAGQSVGKTQRVSNV